MAPGTPAIPRIVHVASGREWRGGQHQVLLLAGGMHRAGIATVVVTGTGTELARRLLDTGVDVEPVDWTAGIDPRVGIRVAGILSSSDIVHAHDSHAHALADAVARLRHTPLVITRRVVFPIRSPARFRRASAVIAISRAVQREVLSVGVEPRRVHVIPDAIDPDASVGAGPAGMATPVARQVVCIAALTREKGLDTLLEAAALVHAVDPSVRWTVIGEGPERAALEARRCRLGLTDAVEFPGDGQSAASALAGASIAVQPSRSEGLGSAVLQALACGVPVVATDVGGLPDALEHGGGILIPPESPAELSDAVMRLLQDGDVRARLGIEARAAARWFHVDLLVNRMIDVYRSLQTHRDRA